MDFCEISISSALLKQLSNVRCKVERCKQESDAMAIMSDS